MSSDTSAADDAVFDFVRDRIRELMDTVSRQRDKVEYAESTLNDARTVLKIYQDQLDSFTAYAEREYQGDA